MTVAMVEEEAGRFEEDSASKAADDDLFFDVAVVDVVSDSVGKGACIFCFLW